MTLYLSALSELRYCLLAFCFVKSLLGMRLALDENKKKMKIYNRIQNSGTVMHFLVQNLKIKNGEQFKTQKYHE